MRITLKNIKLNGDLKSQDFHLKVGLKIYQPFPMKFSAKIHFFAATAL
jgi:hypothetical protein